MGAAMEKTGLPRPELDLKPEKQARDRDTRFVGDDSISDKLIAGLRQDKPIKPRARDTK
jgi:hypothetical protein